MLSASHTLISLPFGVYLDNPILIFLSAFTFHVFCDAFLHWNIFPDTYKKYPFLMVALDVCSGVVFSLLLLKDHLFDTGVILAIAGGNAPDILHELKHIAGRYNRQHFFAWLRPLFELHKNVQLETRSFASGSIWQIVLVIIAIIAVEIRLT